MKIVGANDKNNSLSLKSFIKTSAAREFAVIFVTLLALVTSVFFGIDYFWLKGAFFTEKPVGTSAEWQNIGNFLSIILGVPVALAGSIVAIKLADMATAQSNLALDIQKRQEFSDVRQELRVIVSHANDAYYDLADALNRAAEASQKAVTLYCNSVRSHIVLDNCLVEDCSEAEPGSLKPITAVDEKRYAAFADEISVAFSAARKALCVILKSPFCNKLWAEEGGQQSSVRFSLEALIPDDQNDVPTDYWRIILGRKLDILDLTRSLSNHNISSQSMINILNEFALISLNGIVSSSCNEKRQRIVNDLENESNRIALALLGRLLMPNCTIDIGYLPGQAVGEDEVNVAEAKIIHVNVGAAILCDLIASMPTPGVVRKCLKNSFGAFGPDYENVFEAVASELDATVYLIPSLDSVRRKFATRPSDLITTEIINMDKTIEATGSFFKKDTAKTKNTHTVAA